MPKRHPCPTAVRAGRKRSFFTSRFSTTASMTRSARAISTSAIVALSRGAKRIARCGVGSLRLFVVRHFFQHVSDAVGQCRLGRVGHGDRNLPPQIGRDDAGPHDAGTDHRDRSDLAGRHAGAIDPLIFLVVVGEEEDVDQGPIDGRAEQAGHSFGLLIAGFVERQTRRRRASLPRRPAGRDSVRRSAAGCSPRRSPPRSPVRFRSRRSARSISGGRPGSSPTRPRPAPAARAASSRRSASRAFAAGRNGVGRPGPSGRRYGRRSIRRW